MREIYYAEDDRDIAEGVKAYLEARGFLVRILNSAGEMKKVMCSRSPEAVLVDWNLPDGTGENLCRWIRRQFGEQIPILLLTVRGETKDVVKGFENGADDYLVKPFDLDILYSRLLAVLRRAEAAGISAGKQKMLYCGKLCLDPEKQDVYEDGEPLVFTPTEYRVLLYLMEHKGKTIGRERLLEAIWDISGNYVNDNTLTVTVKRIREKLKNPFYLKTVRSFGYRMEDTV